jgi:hypothetical protein
VVGPDHRPECPQPDGLDHERESDGRDRHRHQRDGWQTSDDDQPGSMTTAAARRSLATTWMPRQRTATEPRRKACGRLAGKRDQARLAERL